MAELDSPNGLIRALSPDEWDTIRKRGMGWRLDTNQHIALRDPTTGRTATARTLKLAYEMVTTR